MGFILQRVISVLKRGPRYAYGRLLFGLSKQPQCFPTVAARVRGAMAVEIGGPSQIFERGEALPVYPLVACIDNYTFHVSANTRYRSEFRATSTLLDRGDASCDLVLSSHMLEHVANPLRALHEWRRVLRRRGHLLLVLPNAQRMYDHTRPITTLQHLIDDFERQIDEDDLTHMPEALALQDRRHWSFYPADWNAIFRDNVNKRTLHHHVFDERLARDMVSRAGFDILCSDLVFPFHIVVFAQS